MHCILACSFLIFTWRAVACFVLLFYIIIIIFAFFRYLFLSYSLLALTLFFCCLSTEFIIHNRWLNTSVTSGSFVFLALSFSLTLSLFFSLCLAPSAPVFLLLSLHLFLLTAELSCLSEGAVKSWCRLFIWLNCALSHTLLLSLSPSLRNSFHFTIFRYFTHNYVGNSQNARQKYFLSFCLYFFALFSFHLLHIFFCHFYCLLGFFSASPPLSIFPFPLHNSLNKARKCCRRFADSKKQIDKKAYEKLCCKTWTECQKEMKKKKQSTVIWLYVV